MRVTLEETEDFYEASGPHPVRLWRGTTEDGKKALALIAAVSIEGAAHKAPPTLRPIPPPVTEWSVAMREAIGELWQSAERLSDAEAGEFMAWVRSRAAFRDPKWPEKKCECCETLWRGPGVYCSFQCAELDAGNSFSVMLTAYGLAPIPDVLFEEKPTDAPPTDYREKVKTNPRHGFLEIARGWMLIEDFGALTQRIESLATWTEVNRPLTTIEERIVKLMIERQLAMGPNLRSNPDGS